MHAVGQQGIFKIQDVREITEEESWTGIWGGDQNMGRGPEGLEQNMGGNQIPWKSHLDSFHYHGILVLN